MSKPKKGLLNLSKIPKSKIWEGKNGDKYIPIALFHNDEPDKYGNTESIMVDFSKEERDSGQKSIYLANLKAAEYEDKTQSGTNEVTDNDLPF